ncbi:MAG: class II glutamine amidotransferase [Candidatus Bipolaricaulota bacterium]
MCRLLGVLSREPAPLRQHFTDAPHGLLAVSLRGAKAPHRDGVGWAYRDARGRMRLYRWGRETLARCDGLPGDLAPETTLVVAHARKASPEYGALVGAIHAQPLVRDGIFLAHNGTIRDVGTLGEGAGTNSQRLLGWLCQAWHPRTTERLAETLGELLGLVRDYTAINLLLTDGAFLFGFCCYTRDPDYYTLHWRRDESAVVVASEPTGGQPGWRRFANGEMLVVGPDLTSSMTAVVP